VAFYSYSLSVGAVVMHGTNIKII